MFTNKIIQSINRLLYRIKKFQCNYPNLDESHRYKLLLLMLLFITNKTVIIMVDAYAFFSGLIYGYIAFVYVTKTKKWIIKSFKKHEDPDPRNLVFLGPLSKLLD